MTTTADLRTYEMATEEVPVDWKAMFEVEHERRVHYQCAFMATNDSLQQARNAAGYKLLVWWDFFTYGIKCRIKLWLYRLQRNWTSS